MQSHPVTGKHLIARQLERLAKGRVCVTHEPRSWVPGQKQATFGSQYSVWLSNTGERITGLEGFYLNDTRDEPLHVQLVAELKRAARRLRRIALDIEAAAKGGGQ